MSRRTYSLTDDPKELQRRAAELLCMACVQPLPEDAAYHRVYCDATCRRRYNRYRDSLTA